MSSLKSWTWTAPRQVVFGWGRRQELGELLAPLGKRVWIICGSRTLQASVLWQQMIEDLTAHGPGVEILTTITREPLTDDVDQAVRQLRECGVKQGDLVLSIGGGSAIDLGKAVAGLVTQSDFQTVVDYLEGVGTGKTLVEPPLPFIAVPTTGGTGSEATRNAVISSINPPYKKSLRSPRLVPELVVIDPELTITAPSQITTWCGMDALTQLLESHISCRATPQTLSLTSIGLRSFPESLRKAIRTPHDRAARETLSYGAYLSGLTLANGGLGIAHGVAASLGVHCKTPHGLACAMLLPLALRLNFRSSLNRLATVGQIWGSPQTSTHEAAQFVLDEVDRLMEELEIPRNLGMLGVSQAKLPEIVKGSQGNSRQGNPLEITDEMLLSSLEEML